MNLPAKLAHLPRAGRLPVPYVALWSAEDGTAYLAPFSAGQPPAVCHREALGQGAPMLGVMSFNRQRRVLVEGLCQVCGRPATTKLVALETGNQQMEMPDGTRRPVLTEPWACHTCARVSLALCPGVRGRTFVRLRRWQLLACYVRPLGDVEQDRGFAPLGPSDFPARGAVGYLKLACVEWEPVTLEAWEVAA